MRRILQTALLLAVVGVFGLAGVKGTEWVLARGEAREAPGGTERATRVSVMQPEAREIDDSVVAVGSIYPHRSIDLRPLADGRVVEVAVASGQRVEEGDLIFRLDARAARASLHEAEATLSETRENYQRYRQLTSENVASDAQIEAARAAFERAEANVEMARANLDDRSLTAPFGGTIGIIDIDPGEYVDNGTVFASLDDRSVVEAEFSLSERYYDRVREGQRVRVSSPVHPDTVFEGDVSVKSPRISRTSRSFVVRVEIENPDRRLTGGMFINAELVFDTYEALTVPDDAVISEGDTSYVYTIDDGMARRTELAVAADLGGRTAVHDGLSDGARVVVTGWDNLTDGAEVQIDEAAPASEALR